MLTLVLHPTHSLSAFYCLIRQSFRVLLTLSLLASTLIAQNDKNTMTLELGKPIERELAGEQSHSYRIILTAGQYLHIVADQRGIDVVVTLFGPDGKRVVEVDSPNGTQGPESVSAIAETSGSYRLEVRSLEKEVPAGRYEVKIEELRKSNEQDRSRIAAERAFKEAEILREQGTAESLQSAIKKYEEAVPLYRIAGDRTGEATALSNTGSVYYSLGEPQKALDYDGKALSLYRAIKDRNGEATVLNNFGEVYYSLGEKEKALDQFTQALPLYQAIGNRTGEATTLSNIGAVYDSLGEKQKALDYYGQSLPLSRAIGDRNGEAVTLNNIGAVYGSLGEKQKALDYYGQSLTLYRAIKDLRGEAMGLKNTGGVYESLGEFQKALDYYAQALPLYRAAGDRRGESITLTSIGFIYNSLGEQQKALDYYEQALPLRRAVGDREGEATVLNNIGGVYDDLGEEQKALGYYTQALTLYRAVGDSSGEALTLNNIGGAYDNLGEKRKALDYYTQALALYGVGDLDDKAMTLNNIGGVYNSLGEKHRALDYFAQALPLYRAVGSRSREAKALTNIGAVYDALGEKQKALDYFAQSLPLSRAVGDRSAEATTLNKLMRIHQSLNNPRFAISYGKQSVNLYQQLRSNIQALDKDIQKTYLRSVEQTYRDLVELLIAQGRAAEAQQVLNAFKDQQFFDFDQTQSKQLRLLARTLREEDWASRYEKASDSLGAISSLRADLKRKLSTHQPNAEESKRLQQLEEQFKTASAEFPALLKQAENEFSQPADEKDKISEVPDTIEMQAALRQLNQGTKQKTAAVYTLIGENNFHTLIITADSVTSNSTPMKSAELNERARQLWGLLQSADYDPTKLSYDLYTIIFKPIEAKLPKDTKTIIWSLDGNLRYLPMAALYDGKQYLVERFNNVVFTRADKERLTRPVSSTWTGYGFATSASHKVELLGTSIAFGPLDFVRDEMQIFRTKANLDGIIDGEVFPEAQFTKASLLAALKQKRPLVHISSHFRFSPGDASLSFLLLGDGKVMTLAEMKEHANLFQGVELLTLSACNTAAQRPDATGREVDAFAELAQRLGAGGVIASLWAVRDSSTAQLMKRFYRSREGGKNTKAESIRKAQLDLLYGNKQDPTIFTNQGSEASRRGSSTDEDMIVEAKYRIPFKKDKKKPFAHPYYWSPFILFGNWR